MVKCTFCGEQISEGTGLMYVYKSGKISHFCSRKCRKNQLVLKRKAIHTKWTQRFIKK